MRLRDTIADLQVGFAIVSNAARFFDRLQGFAWYGELLSSWAQQAGVEAGMSVLDAGCGPGRLSVLLAGQGADVRGIDRSGPMIKRARAQPRPEGAQVVFEQGDLMNLKIENDRFDVCLAASILNVVPDAPGLVRELARVTRPGGVISVLVPTPNFAELAPGLRRSLGLEGFEAAALRAWSSKPPKMSAGDVQACFAEAGCGETTVQTYLQGAVISVSSTLPGSEVGYETHP